MSIIVDGKVYKYYPDDVLYVDGKRVKEVRADGNLVYPWEKVEIHKTTGIPDMVMNFHMIYWDWHNNIWTTTDPYSGESRTNHITLDGIQFDTSGDIYVGAFKKPRTAGGTYYKDSKQNSSKVDKSADLYSLLLVFISEEQISQNSTAKIEHNGHTFYFADITYPLGYEYYHTIWSDGTARYSVDCSTDEGKDVNSALYGLYNYYVGKTPFDLAYEYYGDYVGTVKNYGEAVGLADSCPGQATAKELYSYLEKATETDNMTASAHYFDMIHAAYDI